MAPIPGSSTDRATGTNYTDGGGAIHLQDSSATITNMILWQERGAWANVDLRGSSTLSVSYSDVEGGQSSVHVDSGGTLTWGAGMIDADPLFVDPANGDFRLQQDPCQTGVVNPCVDAGNPASAVVMGTTRTDWVQDSGVVDMGFHYTIPMASATFRNAGSNPASYAVVSLPLLGGTYSGTIDLSGTTGHPLAWLVGFATPLTVTLDGGQTVLVNIADPNGELLAQPMLPGPLATYALPVPSDPAFAGLALSTQALHVGGMQPFALSNAQDLILGS